MLIASTSTGREIADVHQSGDHVFVNFGRLGMMLTAEEALSLASAIDEASTKAAIAENLAEQLRAVS